MSVFDDVGDWFGGLLEILFWSWWPFGGGVDRDHRVYQPRKKAKRRSGE